MSRSRSTCPTASPVPTSCTSRRRRRRWRDCASRCSTTASPTPRCVMTRAAETLAARTGAAARAGHQEGTAGTVGERGDPVRARHLRAGPRPGRHRDHRHRRLRELHRLQRLRHHRAREGRTPVRGGHHHAVRADRRDDGRRASACPTLRTLVLDHPIGGTARATLGAVGRRCGRPARHAVHGRYLTARARLRRREGSPPCRSWRTRRAPGSHPARSSGSRRAARR